MPKKLLYWKNIHTIVFDFDGIFTNNKVYVDQNGVESIRCDRGDGLGFDMLRNFMEFQNWPLEYFILSKEKNYVVSVRSQKLGIDCVQSITKKSDYISYYLKKKKLNFKGLVYLGNDLNDLLIMNMAGFSVAPIDAHPVIIKQADLVLQKKGGDGFVRAFIELLIGIKDMSMNEIILTTEGEIN